MPIRKIKQINLIPQDEFESSNFGRVLKWALSTFRVMVIVTELVVMSAFLSRFWLDSKNSDLNDEINVSKSQIAAYKNVEDEFRSIQKRLSIARSLYALPKISTTIAGITGLVPEDITITTLSNTDDQIVIKATSFSERSIAQFLVNLEKNKDLSDINLAQVNSNLENSGSATTFAVTATISKLAQGGNK